MKATFSEEYYRQFWNKFLEEVPGVHYRNLEAELERAMRVYHEAGLPEEAIVIIRKMEAQKIADSCRALVLEEMDVVKRINAGEASFGMTTERQETEARFEYITRFEFNCLQLADFRKKYLA